MEHPILTRIRRETFTPLGWFSPTDMGVTKQVILIGNAGPEMFQRFARSGAPTMDEWTRAVVEPLAQVLKNLGLRKALVVHGNDGLDEITTTDKTFISEYNGLEVISYDIDPQELGIARARIEDLDGGGKEENAEILKTVLQSSKGPKRDVVVLNAAYGLYTAGSVENITQGLRMAEHAIDSGRAYQKLQELKEFTSSVR